MKREDVLLELPRHLRNGRANALSARDLAAAVGCSERVVGAVVSELIDRGMLIGSLCEAEHHGYFFIADLEDLDVGTRHIRSRAIASLQRISHLKKAAAQAFSEGEALQLFDLQEVS